MGCHFLLQGIFPTQGLNRGLPHSRQTLKPLSHQGSSTKPSPKERGIERHLPEGGVSKDLWTRETVTPPCHLKGFLLPLNSCRRCFCPSARHTVLSLNVYFISFMRLGTPRHLAPCSHLAVTQQMLHESARDSLTTHPLFCPSIRPTCTLPRTA